MSVDFSGFWEPPSTVQPSQLHASLPLNMSYRNPIPPCMAVNPGELLDKLYRNRRNRFNETDVSGVLLKQTEVHLHHPKNAAAPIGSSGLVGKWPRPNGLRAEPVPVHGVALDGLEAVVEFRSLGSNSPSAGVSLIDLYEWKRSALKGATETIKFGRKDLRFVIAWPGYQPQRFTIGTGGSNGGPLTRIDLGRKIAVIYAVFFMDVTTEGMLPSEVGFFNIALHQGQNARSDSLGVQVTQLHLVRLRGSNGGDWVADVEIV